MFHCSFARFALLMNTLLMVITILYVNSNKSFYKQVSNRLLDKKTSRAEKLILTWTPYFGEDIAAILSSYSSKCLMMCQVTSNKSRTLEADAIMFHAWDRGGPLPSARHSSQRYIFVTYEAPTTSWNAKLEYPQNFFNWTQTYHPASDIHVLSGLLQLRDKTETGFKEIVAKKTKLVAWMVSNCNVHSSRGDYVAELKKYIPIDQYGTCSKDSLKCPRNDECERKLTTDYHFYLSFENSVCNNYITEKFFFALKRWVVPIVLRQSDYLGIAPNGSYIAADQFRSPKHLAFYLQFLASNPEEYIKYFDWKKKYEVLMHDELAHKSFCQLCHMLHSSETTSSIQDIERWWHERNACVKDFAKHLL